MVELKSCSDVRNEYPQETAKLSCCTSCHEDEEQGFDVMCESVEGYYVCCTMYQLLEKQKTTPTSI